MIQVGNLAERWPEPRRRPRRAHLGDLGDRAHEADSWSRGDGRHLHQEDNKEGNPLRTTIPDPPGLVGDFTGALARREQIASPG